MFSTREIARDIGNWIRTRPDVMPERPPRRLKRQTRPFQPMKNDGRRYIALHATEVWGDMPQWPSRCPPTPPPPIYLRDPMDEEEMEIERIRSAAASAPPIETSYLVVVDDELIEVERPPWEFLPQSAIPEVPNALGELKLDTYGNILQSKRQAQRARAAAKLSTAAMNTPSPHGTATATTARGRPRSNAVSIPTWVTHPEGETSARGTTTTATTARGRPRSNAISLPRQPKPPQHVSEELTDAEWRMRVRLAAIRERARAPVTPPSVMPVHHEEEFDSVRSEYPETAFLNGTSSLHAHQADNIDWRGFSETDQAQVEASWRAFDEYMASIQQ